MDRKSYIVANDNSGRPPGGVHSGHAATVLAALLILGLGHGIAIGAEWTVAPDIRVGMTTNDNPRLREGSDDVDQEIWGAFADLGALARWRTPSSSVALRPRVYLARHPDDEEWDTEDYLLDFSASNSGQRNEWTLDGNVRYDYVLRAEQTQADFADPEFDDPAEAGTGLVDARQRRTLWSVRPGFARQLTERVEAGVGVNYLDVSYSEREELGPILLDYTNAGAGAFLNYQATEAGVVQANMYASRFEADELNNQTDSMGIGLRYEHELSEISSVFAGTGAQRSDIEAGDNLAVDITETDYFFEFGGQREWERTNLRLAASRQFLPSGSGFLRSVDELRFALRHRFHPRWNGELLGIAQQSDAFGSEDELDARDYYRLGARLRYELTRTWRLEARYSHTYQDYDRRPGTARANEFFLSVNYQPRGQVWSW